MTIVPPNHETQVCFSITAESDSFHTNTAEMLARLQQQNALLALTYAQMSEGGDIGDSPVLGLSVKPGTAVELFTPGTQPCLAEVGNIATTAAKVSHLLRIKHSEYKPSLTERTQDAAYSLSQRLVPDRFHGVLNISSTNPDYRWQQEVRKGIERYASLVNGSKVFDIHIDEDTLDRMGVDAFFNMVSSSSSRACRMHVQPAFRRERPFESFLMRINSLHLEFSRRQTGNGVHAVWDIDTLCQMAQEQFPNDSLEVVDAAARNWAEKPEPGRVGMMLMTYSGIPQSQYMPAYGNNNVVAHASALRRHAQHANRFPVYISLYPGTLQDERTTKHFVLTLNSVKSALQWQSYLDEHRTH